MKAIKIDAEKQSVYEVEVDETNVLKSWYKILNVDIVEMVPHVFAPQLDKSDRILVDEEGLINNKHDEGFILRPIGYKFIGSGLVIGTNKSGGSVSCRSTVQQVESIVSSYFKTRLTEEA